jgi:hypothetical protein
MAVMEGTTKLKTWRGLYSVAIDGGTVGTKTMRSNDGPLPNGAVILGGYLNVIAAAGSAGSPTVAVQANAANDIINAAAFDGAPWSSTGKKSIIPAHTGATAVTCTASRNPAVVIATATVTLLSIELVLEYR